MDFVTITCPHCGYSKSAAPNAFPEGAFTATCPKCQKTFHLDGAPDSPSSAQEPAWAFHANAESDTPPVRNAINHQPEGAANHRESKYCTTCGNKLHSKAEICPHCGVRVAPPPSAVNKVALLVITFFLGAIGGHKFYLKKYLAGALYLLFFWTYIPALIAFVEFIIYACKSEQDLQRQYPQASNTGIVFVLIVPLFAIAIIGILAAIAIPQFAAYRQKAYNATANAALESCKTQTDLYFADHRAYPTEASQMQCDAPPGISLYYLSLGPEKYQLISYHNRSCQAFVSDSEAEEIATYDREPIKAEITEKYGAQVVGEDFHFLK